MIKPAKKDDLFLADVRDAEPNTTPGCHLALWWLGQAGFLLKATDTETNARHMLLDPYLSDSLTKKYAKTEIPHDRMTEIVIAPARLDFVDVITSSHNHTDHLDAETICPILEAKQGAPTKMVVVEAGKPLAAERLGVEPNKLIGMDDGREVDVAGFKIFGVPAAHETIETDDQGRHQFLGYVIRVGGRTIYHAGDTVRYDGMVERLRPLNIDVALLPINGPGAARGVAGNLAGPEAAILAHEIGAKLAVPCHYDMFHFNTASPAAFIAICRQLGQPYRVLKCGQRLVVS